MSISQRRLSTNSNTLVIIATLRDQRLICRRAFNGRRTRVEPSAPSTREAPIQLMIRPRTRDALIVASISVANTTGHRHQCQNAKNFKFRPSPASNGFRGGDSNMIRAIRGALRRIEDKETSHDLSASASLSRLRKCGR